MRRLLGTLLVLLVGAAGASCGDDGAPPPASTAASTEAAATDGTTAGAEASTAAAAASAGSTAAAVDADAAPVGALATIGQYLVAANLAEVARLGGVEPGSEEIIGVYVRELSAPTRLVQGLAAHPDALQRELGIALADVTWMVDAGTPPTVVTAIAGAIDPARVEAAVTSFQPFADDVRRSEEDGFAVFTLGDGTFDPAKRTPLRRLGIGGTIAVRDGLALFGDDEQAVLGAVAAAAGGSTSLTADPIVAGIAARLAAAGASSFAMVPPEPGAAFALSAVAAVGPAEQGATVLVLGYGDAASATAGADVLRRLIAEGSSQVAKRTWAELLGTPAPEIAVEDATVVARFAAPAARRILFRAFSARDFIWAQPAPG